MKLNQKALGLAGGLIWGGGIFFITLISIKTSYAQMLLMLLIDIYPGYSISISGAFMGLIWGFVDAFLGGYILAWLYNWFDKKFS